MTPGRSPTRPVAGASAICSTDPPTRQPSCRFPPRSSGCGHAGRSRPGIRGLLLGVSVRWESPTGPRWGAPARPARCWRVGWRWWTRICACTPGGVGFLNPLLYKLGEEDVGVFDDVTAYGNDVGHTCRARAGKPLGCCTARAGYDLASGWGSIDLGQFGSQALALLPKIPQPLPVHPAESESRPERSGPGCYSVLCRLPGPGVRPGLNCEERQLPGDVEPGQSGRTRSAFGANPFLCSPAPAPARGGGPRAGNLRQGLWGTDRCAGRRAQSVAGSAGAAQRLRTLGP